MREAEAPTKSYSVSKVANKKFWGKKEENFDITVDEVHEFYADGICVKNCMGRFHPHGDTAIYDALVNMTRLPVRLIDPMGFFGSVTEKRASAMRYTECRLTKYSETQLASKAYLPVIKMAPNYDGREQEPVYLPALYPNLLLNGSEGIAVGLTSGIPSMHVDCLMPFIEEALDGKEVSVKKFAKKVRFNWPYGSKCISDEETILNWLEHGSGFSLNFEPTYSADGDTRTLKVTEAPPNFNWDRVVENVAGENKKTGKPNYQFVSSIDNYSSKKNGIEFVVKFKTSLPREDFMDYVYKIMAEFTTTFKTATNVTHRKGVNTEQIKLFATTIPELITLWTDYRVNLEVRYQKHLIELLDADDHRQDLLLLAIENMDTIVKILKSSNSPDEELSKKLKITIEDAKYILDQAIRRLSRISKTSIENEKERIAKEKKTATKHKNNPQPKVLADMSDNLSIIEKAQERDVKKKKKE